MIYIILELELQFGPQIIWENQTHWNCDNFSTLGVTAPELQSMCTYHFVFSLAFEPPPTRINIISNCSCPESQWYLSILYDYCTTCRELDLSWVYHYKNVWKLKFERWKMTGGPKLEFSNEITEYDGPQ